MITAIKHRLSILVIFVLFLNTNAYPRGGGRGGGSSGRGRTSIHRGGGGSDWSSVNSGYGDTFGYRGLPYNSYLYRDWDSLKSLTSSLFYGTKVTNRDKEQFYRRWNDNKDKEWRETTRAPYFENKIPGKNKILPASAVIGAATAFGVVSLLPLDVPPGKPLMYCVNTDIHQSQLRINDQNIFICNNKNVEVLCRKTSNDDKCLNEVLQYDTPNGFVDRIYCSDGALFSTTHLFCNSTTSVNGKNSKDELTILNCYDGQLPRSQISFVPTSTTTEWSIFTTTPKPLSFSANLHISLLKILGKSEVLETTTPETFPYTNSMAWRAQALMVTTELTTENPTQTTARRPYVWMEKEYIYYDNGTADTTYIPLPAYMQDESKSFYASPNWHRIYTTTTEEVTTSTTTEAPQIWMRKINSSGNQEKLEPVPTFIIDIAEQFSSNFPSNWFRVPASESLMNLINFNRYN